MYEERRATLKMLDVLIENGECDHRVHRGQVLKYDQERERIHLLLEGSSLLEVMLDATYECQIASEPNEVSCKGLIIDRYNSERGNILCFQIKSGFYEINIK